MAFAEGTPTVTVTLGGKCYTLGWTWGSKRRLKEWTKANGVDAQSAQAMGESLPAMLWASMDKEDRDSISVSQVEELINPRNEVAIAEKIGEMFRVSEPEPDIKAAPVAAKEKPLTTGNSTSMNSEHLESTISV